MFLAKQELLQGYQDALVVAVYSDRISAFAVHRGKDETTTHGWVEEMREETNAVSPDEFALNMHKVVAAHARTAGGKLPARVICALADGSVARSYVRVRAVREDAERRITRDEIDALLARKYGQETNTAQEALFRNFPQRLFVDGFAVEDPVGMRGKEIGAGIYVVSARTAVADAMQRVARQLGMSCAGYVDIPHALASAVSARAGKNDCVCASVFNRETAVLLVRGGVIAGADTIVSGYGILEQAIANEFGVGIVEARRIAGYGARGAPDDSVAERVRRVALACAPVFAKRVAEGYARLDKENLLPGMFFIGIPSVFSEFSAALADPQCIVDLPVERGAVCKDITPFFPETSDAAEIFDRVIVAHCAE